MTDVHERSARGGRLHLYEDMLRANKASRIQRSTTPKTYEYSYAPKRLGDGATACAPGTVTIYLARPNSAELASIQKSVAANQPIEKRLFESIQSEFSKRKPVSLDKALATITALPNYLDITYGDVEIARELFLPQKLNLAFVQLPWSGKTLDLASVNVKEYLKTTRSPQLEVIVVYNPPKLSRPEKAALAKVPDDMRYLHIGTMADTNFFTPCLAMVAVVATVVAICAGRPLGTERLTESTLRNLSAAGTIDELLDLRLRNLAEQ